MLGLSIFDSSVVCKTTQIGLLSSLFIYFKFQKLSEFAELKNHEGAQFEWAWHFLSEKVWALYRESTFVVWNPISSPLFSFFVQIWQFLSSFSFSFPVFILSHWAWFVQGLSEVWSINRAWCSGHLSEAETGGLQSLSTFCLLINNPLSFKRPSTASPLTHHHLLVLLF